MKWPWWRAVQGALTLRGHRLDGATSPLEAKIPKGYGDSGFQATGLIFPNEGCWEITAEAGGSALTIITQVVRERSEG